MGEKFGKMLPSLLKLLARCFFMFGGSFFFRGEIINSSSYYKVFICRRIGENREAEVNDGNGLKFFFSVKVFLGICG